MFRHLWRTIFTLDHPPISCKANNGVPACTPQRAQV
jgi:hypothetical protein